MWRMSHFEGAVLEFNTRQLFPQRAAGALGQAIGVLHVGHLVRVVVTRVAKMRGAKAKEHGLLF